jgi:carboxylesterase
VSCPLIAGHGGTREALNSSKWTDWVSSLEEAHDKLRETCDFIIVGGLSAGGVMCLNLAAKRPASVHAVCLFAPTLYPDGWAIPWYFHLLNVFRHKWAMELFFLPEREPYGIKDERLRRFVIGALEAQPGGKERLSGFYGGTFIEFRWMVQAVRASLSSIKQPTLIVHPREDDRSSLRNAAYLQRRLGGIVETVVLNDSYHVCTLDRQRDVVVERALAFGERMRERSRGSQSQASNLQALRRR